MNKVYNCEERIGVHSIAKIFEEELNWLFSEQSVNDFGIDAYVEITRAGFDIRSRVPIGKLIGVQIKSGQSFFKEETHSHFVFRGLKKHLDYWLNHSIPVILIIYNKRTGNAYWREVNKSTVIMTKASFKVYILKQNLLSYSGREDLARVAFTSDRYSYKLWQIQTSLFEVKALTTKPLFLFVEIDDIPNSDYCHITLMVTDNGYVNFPEVLYTGNDDNQNQFEYYFLFSKNKGLKEAINDVLPWADLFINGMDFTDELLSTTIVDDILNFEQEELTREVLELKGEKNFFHLACYLTGSYCFRLELKANKLGYAFLELEGFLDKESIVKPRIFL